MSLNRREMMSVSVATGLAGAQALAFEQNAKHATADIRIGMIGLDTSHASIFTKLLNQENQDQPRLAGCRVVAAFPAGNPQFPLSRDRIEGFTNEVKACGVRIVDSIESLLPLVDVVLLESVDGTQHLEQARPVFAAQKPIFIDKPLAASLSDVLEIVELGKATQTPWFTASSSRFTEGYPELKQNTEMGQILGCDVYSQSRAAPGHPDLFWYGVHGVDLLYSLMGTGCQTVTALQTQYTEQVTGTWEHGRVGTYRAIREHTGKTGLGATVFGTQGIFHVNNFYNYVSLLAAIMDFFRTKVSPISLDEMMEEFTFLEAAEESKKRGVVPVTLTEVRQKSARKP